MSERMFLFKKKKKFSCIWRYLEARKKCHLLQLYIFSFSVLQKPFNLTLYIVCCHILFSIVLAALKHMYSDYLIGSVTYNQMTQTCATVQELKLVSSCITTVFSYSFLSFFSFFRYISSQCNIYLVSWRLIMAPSVFYIAPIKCFMLFFSLRLTHLQSNRIYSLSLVGQ